MLALIKLHSDMQARFNEAGAPKAPLWEDISKSMAEMGYANRNAKRCKEKWENINKYFKRARESNKQRPENAKTCPYFHELDALYRKPNHFSTAAATVATTTTTTTTTNSNANNNKISHVAPNPKPYTEPPIPVDADIMDPSTTSATNISSTHVTEEEDPTAVVVNGKDQKNPGELVIKNNTITTSTNAVITNPPVTTLAPLPNSSSFMSSVLR